MDLFLRKEMKKGDLKELLMETCMKQCEKTEAKLPVRISFAPVLRDKNCYSLTVYFFLFILSFQLLLFAKHFSNDSPKKTNMWRNP